MLKMNDHEFRLVHQLMSTVVFAAEKHKNHRRKTGGSYIVHPLNVAMHLMHARVDDLPVLQAAVLHDTVEDTDTTLEEIAEKFGVTVARYVAEVSDDKELAKDERKRLQVEHAKTSSAGAFAIKMADALDNLSGLLLCPPPNWDRDRIKGYFVWKKAVTGVRTGVNEILERQLAALFGEVIGEDDDEQQLLNEYYQSMAQCGESD